MIPILCTVSSPTPATTNEVRIMLAGLIDFASVSVMVQQAYHFQLLPFFDRFGLYACDVSLSVPTSGGFVVHVEAISSMLSHH